MKETQYRNRRAVEIENDLMRMTVLVEGGHIAEIYHKKAGVNPLWTPPWPSIEPSTYNLSKHPEYGADAESKLLSGLMGHNLCLDVFGGPSPEEVAAGMTVHGEASINPYTFEGDATTLLSRTVLQAAQLRVDRRMRLATGSSVVVFTETVENLSPLDRPVAWTEHVTLGPPFLELGAHSISCLGHTLQSHRIRLHRGQGGSGDRRRIRLALLPAQRRRQHRFAHLH